MQRSRNGLFIWSDRNNWQRGYEKIYWSCRICPQHRYPDRRRHLSGSAGNKKIVRFSLNFPGTFAPFHLHTIRRISSTGLSALNFPWRPGLHSCSVHRPVYPAILSLNHIMAIAGEICVSKEGNWILGVVCNRRGEKLFVVCHGDFPQIKKNPVNPTLITRGSAWI